MSQDTRDVAVQWSNTAMVGDELLELWIKRGSDAWALEDTVAVSALPTQDYTFTIDAGQAAVFQIRARRLGTYRDEYLSADPEDWPATSRLAYTTTLPTGVLAFTEWARTDASTQVLRFSWSHVNTTRAVRFYRDDGGGFDLIDTIAAGTSIYEYVIQAGEDATTLDFKIDQQDDDGVAEPSNTLSVYAGVPAPINLTQFAGPDWYAYTAEWDNVQVGATTRVQDDYCGAFADRTTTTSTSATVSGLTKLSAMDENGNDTVVVNVRIRSEMTAFAVTDVSEWVEVAFNVDIAPDETAYGAC